MSGFVSRSCIAQNLLYEYQLTVRPELNTFTTQGERHRVTCMAQSTTDRPSMRVLQGHTFCSSPQYGACIPRGGLTW